MSECELISTCPFFADQLGNKPDSIEEMKEKYCKKNNLNCARYMLINSFGKEKMLPDLYPHEKERVYVLIAENS